MGSSSSKEQKNFDQLLKDGRKNLDKCVIQTDTIYLNTPYSKNPTKFESLQFKHYLTFPNLYEGLKLWEGAILLLRHILSIGVRDKYEYKSIMDLGAGMGIIGISLAKILHCEVTMTDYIPEVLDLCRENTNLNFKNVENTNCDDENTTISLPVTEHLDWNNFEHSNCVKKNKKYDIIIGCELVYAVTQCDNLIRLIQ